MKKFYSLFVAIILLFSTMGGLAVDAKGSVGGGARGGGSFSKPSTSTSKSSPTKSSGVKTSTSSTPAQKKFKMTPRYNTAYQQPPNMTDSTASKYKNKSYFDGSSFATSLLTAAGVYLLLDSFDDDGNPVYIDADTGKVIDEDDLDDLDVQPADDSEDSEENGALVFGIVVFIVVLVILIVVLALRF